MMGIYSDPLWHHQPDHCERAFKTFFDYGQKFGQFIMID